MGRVWAVIALAFLSCDPEHDTAAVDQFIKDQAAQVCEWQYKCCTDAEIKVVESTKYMSEMACEPYEVLELGNFLYTSRLGVRQGRVTVDTKQASLCIEQLKNKPCNQSNGQAPPPDPTYVDQCQKIYVGSTPIGSECRFAGECVK